MSQTIELPLTKGFMAIIDAVDYELVTARDPRDRAYGIPRKWRCSHNGIGRVHACSSRYGGGQDELSRLILGVTDHNVVDHKNGDTLDNRRTNLRVCTQAENTRNQKSSKNSTSKFKGVSWCKAPKKWRVYLRANAKNLYLGSYNIEKEAARVYNDAALKYHGEFARLNEI